MADEDNFSFEIVDDTPNSGAAGTGGGGEGQTSAPSPAADKTEALERELRAMQETVSTVQTDNQRLMQTAQQLQQEEQMESVVRDAKKKTADAQAKLAAAYDEGDGTAIAAAQAELSRTAAAEVQINTVVAQRRDQAKRQAEQPQPSASKDDSNLRAWREKHSSWYGVDNEMTQAALAIDRQIRRDSGVAVGSPAYFEEIDRRMSAQYPEKLRGSPGSITPTPGGGEREIKHRISRSVADGMRAMGLDMDDPKIVRRVVEARQNAVEKGILPETPITGRVR